VGRFWGRKKRAFQPVRITISWGLGGEPMTGEKKGEVIGRKKVRRGE